VIATYYLRLAILCFASFFLIHLSLGLLSKGLLRWFAQALRSMRPQQVSKISIALRLGPACLSILMVMFVSVPSYLRYEGNGSHEEIGLLCLVPACLGCLICLIAIARSAHAIIQSNLLTQKLETGGDPGLWHLNRGVDELPSIGLIGLFKSKVIVSPSVLKILTSEQFQAALDHERAHRSSCDNLKRLLILLAPDLFPFTRNFRAVESLWERSAELSADDLATLGQPLRSIALAEALIKLARLERSQTSVPLVSGLFAAPEGLTLRVERLLQQSKPTREVRPIPNAAVWLGLTLLLLVSVCVPLQISQDVYHLLESLLR
jgi:hypothetical protein